MSPIRDTYIAGWHCRDCRPSYYYDWYGHRDDIITQQFWRQRRNMVYEYDARQVSFELQRDAGE